MDTGLKFIVDQNAGKMVRWLRMLGYDALFFSGDDDGDMVLQALTERRIIITRDTLIARRRPVTGGRVRVVLIHSDRPEVQIKQIVAELKLRPEEMNPLSLCLECNTPLVAVDKAVLQDRVPEYVYQHQDRFVECPRCHRVYWQGTHWQSMIHKMNSWLGENIQDINNNQLL